PRDLCAVFSHERFHQPGPRAGNRAGFAGAGPSGARRSRAAATTPRVLHGPPARRGSCCMSTALSSLAGSLRVAPGAPLPLALQSSRQDWAPRLARGQAVSALPGPMASLFNLCSHAHRLCSQLAIEAAAPGLLPVPHQVAQRLRTETAQEHIRRIGLDWPRLLATDAQGSWATLAQTALQACPLIAPATTAAA